MSTTQPIRNLEDIQKIKNYFLLENKLRDYTLITIVLNTALRISDILNLTWGDVYDFKKKKFYRHLFVIERKTKKSNEVLLNQSIQQALSLLLCSLEHTTPETYIFTSRKGENQHISRVQAYRILKEVSRKLELEKTISCHSLRKTFGYHAWKQGTAPALIMNVYNHSSFHITKRYLGIEQDDRDILFEKINL